MQFHAEPEIQGPAGKRNAVSGDPGHKTAGREGFYSVNPQYELR